MSVFKCRRCRCVLFTEECVLTSHGEPLFDESQKTTNLTSDSLDGTLCDKISPLWFISIGCVCPEWVSRCLNKGQWTKGKLLCPKCRGRVGSFDFKSHQNCHCGQFAPPPVHVNRNRVDFSSGKSQKKISAPKSGKNYGKSLTSVQSVTPCGKSALKENKSTAVNFLQSLKTTSGMASRNQTISVLSSDNVLSPLPALAKTSIESHISCMPIFFNSDKECISTSSDVELSAPTQSLTSDSCESFGNMSSLAKGNSNVDNFMASANRIGSMNSVTSPSKNGQNLNSGYNHLDISENANEVFPLELISNGYSDSMTNSTELNNVVHQSDMDYLHNNGIETDNLDPESNSHNISTISEATFAAPKKRHKRVTSDCSWLQYRDNVALEPGSHLDSSSSRTNSSEDVHTRHQGNSSRPLPLSTALLRKRYGHRRALSMTATSNRFEFLPDDIDMQTTGFSERKKVYRQASMEIAEPSIPVEFTCPVCLDLLCNPHSCLPCQHTFCESCLRQLARTQPDKTSCPMCRQIIVQCQPQHLLSFHLKSDYPMMYSRRRKATRKPHGKLHPLPQLKADLRHKLGVVMQSRLRGRRLQELCRDHFIMTFFVYTGAVALLLGVFLLLILICCKSLFFLFLLIQWMLFGLLRFGTSAAEVALTISPSLIATTTEATLANRVILSLIGLGLVYKVWIGISFRDRAHQQHTFWRF